eukprot:TRINITY_DN61_c1_g1_i2.p5 TRINITY_DN61_c1_g1~~TRINITY_DN61_c1_g1_i2.p5  ORF type:complete len:104 (+),score=36.65 TRINITY_DN61_c1_g1_i2:599-910(+)
MKEIIDTGRTERYQVECEQCGHSWYTSPDALAAAQPAPPPPVATLPTFGSTATEKFATVEQRMAQAAAATPKEAATDEGQAAAAAAEGAKGGGGVQGESRAGL